MTCWKWFGNYIASKDTAPKNVGFKYNSKFEFKTVTGGFFTLLGKFLIYSFSIFLILKVWKMEEILSVETRDTDLNAANVSIPVGKGMIFAIGVRELDLRYERIFDFKLSRIKETTIDRNLTKIEIIEKVDLVPCTKKDWDLNGLS
jgi:hypothetical protein